MTCDAEVRSKERALSAKEDRKVISQKPTYKNTTHKNINGALSAKKDIEVHSLDLT